ETTRWRPRGRSAIRSSRRGHRCRARCPSTRPDRRGPERPTSSSRATTGGGRCEVPSVTGLETPGVWSAEGTSPSAIEGALRQLLEQQYQRDEAYAPARVLNLVAIVDREWRGEIVHRPERPGRSHPAPPLGAAGEPRPDE